MQFLYTLSIYGLILGIRLASLFNKKAQQAIEGRKNWKHKLKDKLNGNTQKIIWFHVSSLGEFEQARPLIVQIRKQFPHYRILITFFSPSGYNAQKNFEYADDVFYLPYDTPQNAIDFMDIVKPRFIFFVKYEFWLNFLNEIIRRKVQGTIHCFLISSIFRKHQPFFKWYGKIFINGLAAFDKIFVQDKLSMRLLKKINIESNVILSGDTRIDRVIEIAHQTYQNHEIEQFCNNQKVIICGSTWYQDEKIVLPVLKNLRTKYDIKIMIAPHHPDEKNVSHLETLLNQYELLHCRYTQIQSIGLKELSEKNVLIIDTIGILNKIYRYGYVAYIGGGFTDGIHNILEPAVYGLPVIFGKKYHKFYEATELIKMKAAFAITNETELSDVLENLLGSNTIYTSAQHAVNEFIDEHKGGVSRTMTVLEKYLNY
ncbi:MAG: 3-deoxy-D-manno-octulosonic acid transferase [Bacteroidia bacterium]|nr:3-deoxy-D-manno-octulosonic acid transferase [Bacteroidia bacterium]